MEELEEFYFKQVEVKQHTKASGANHFTHASKSVDFNPVSVTPRFFTGLEILREALVSISGC